MRKIVKAPVWCKGNKKEESIIVYTNTDNKIRIFIKKGHLMFVDVLKILTNILRYEIVERMNQNLFDYTKISSKFGRSGHEYITLKKCICKDVSDMPQTWTVIKKLEVNSTGLYVEPIEFTLNEVVALAAYFVSEEEYRNALLNASMYSVKDVSDGFDDEAFEQNIEKFCLTYREIEEIILK